jgi:hypothetical protein
VEWTIYGLYALNPSQPFLEWISKPAARWLREPGNTIRVSVWTGALAIVAITVFSPKGSLLNDLRTDAIAIAVAVIVIDELNRYRAKLEEKKRIIQQFASRSNDFALDAARIIVLNHWHKDGSLKGAFLVWANLAGVALSGANLEGALLIESNLYSNQNENRSFVNDVLN